MRRFRIFFLALLTLGTSALAQPPGIPPLPPITEPPSGQYLPGKFIWADLFSSDMETSQRFYSQVFGWEWQEIKAAPDPYGLFHLDGEPVAGLAHREAPGGGERYGRWIHYISVGDVGATEKAVGAQGGTVILASRSYRDRGDFAILSDAQHAPFGILRSSSGDPGDYQAAHGDWIWRQLFTGDMGAAIRFYTGLFGYETETDENHAKVVKYLLESDGFLRAGIGLLPPESDSAPTWLGFVRVDDIDATLQRVRANGGKVLVEPKADIVEGGLAIVADPTGATIGLLRWQYPDADQGGTQP